MLGRFCKPVSSFGLGLPPFQSFRVKPKCMDHTRVHCYSPFCPWEGLREGPPCLALFWGRGRSHTLAGCLLDSCQEGRGIRNRLWSSRAREATGLNLSGAEVFDAGSS